MRIEQGNSYRSFVERTLLKQPEKAGKEPVLPLEIAPPPAEDAQKAQQSEKDLNPDAMQQQLGLLGQQMTEEREKQKSLLLCLEIARRIAGGDTVPQADHKYLREHDSAMYAKAIMMRFPKNNPYKYKQLSREEDHQDSPEAAQLKQLTGYESLKALTIQSDGAALDLNL
jgi:hypothetical protein